MFRRLRLIALLSTSVAFAAAQAQHAPYASQTITSMSVTSKVPDPDFTVKTPQQIQAANSPAAGGRKLFADILPQGTTDGIVASQTPKPGTLVYPGEQRLVVTLKPRPNAASALLSNILKSMVAPPSSTAPVPDLIGKNRNEASAALETAHLQASFSGDSAGQVVQQDPAAGLQANLGSIVSVFLQNPLVTVPFLTGMTSLQAASVLADRSLQVGRVSGPDTDSSTVSGQSIAAGTSVLRYTTLTSR